MAGLCQPRQSNTLAQGQYLFVSFVFCNTNVGLKRPSVLSPLILLLVGFVKPCIPVFSLGREQGLLAGHQQLTALRCLFLFGA